MSEDKTTKVCTGASLGPEAFNTLEEFERAAGMTLREWERQHNENMPWYMRDVEELKERFYSLREDAQRYQEALYRITKIRSHEEPVSRLIAYDALHKNPFGAVLEGKE